MIKKIFLVLKKVIMAALLLFAYNNLAVSFNAVIPINYITVIGVSILGIPAIIGFVIFNILFI